MRALYSTDASSYRALQAIAARDSLLISRRFTGLRRRIAGYPLDRLLPGHGYDVARSLCGTRTDRRPLHLAQVLAAALPRT